MDATREYCEILSVFLIFNKLLTTTRNKQRCASHEYPPAAATVAVEGKLLSSRIYMQRRTRGKQTSSQVCRVPQYNPPLSAKVTNIHGRAGLSLRLLVGALFFLRS